MMILNLILFSTVASFIEATEKKMYLSPEESCLNEHTQQLMDNHDVVYEKISKNIRQQKPTSDASTEEYTCCTSFKEIYLPVGKIAKFKSPNYPDKYPSDMDCSWNFNTDDGYTFDMQCSLIHLKRNDYLYMQESHSSYSYVENLRDENMVYYFWNSSAEVGFHSDRETGAEGFECEIWPVNSCVSAVIEKVSSGGLLVIYSTGLTNDYQIFTCEEAENFVGCKDSPSFVIDTPVNTMRLVGKLGKLIFLCDQEANLDCYKLDLNQPNPSWEFYASLKDSTDVDSDYLRYTVSFTDRLIFVGESYQFEITPNSGDKKFEKVEHQWKPDGDVRAATSDGKFGYALVRDQDYSDIQNSKFSIWQTSSQSKLGEWTRAISGLKAFIRCGFLALGDYLYLAGGSSMYNIDTVYKINVKTWEVRELDGSGKLPEGTSYANMALINNKPAVFGGLTDNGFTSNVYVYDAIANKWEKSSLRVKPEFILSVINLN